MRWGEQDGVTFSYTFSSANRACREQRVQDVAMLVSYRSEVLADARSKDRARAKSILIIQDTSVADGWVRAHAACVPFSRMALGRACSWEVSWQLHAAAGRKLRKH